MFSPLANVHNLSSLSKDILKLWELADLHLKLGRISQSLHFAHLATQEDDSQQKLYREHYLKAIRLGAELAEEIGNHLQAEYYWLQLIKYTTNNVDAWYGLAIAQANLGKYSEAKTSARQVLKFDPQHQKVRSLLMSLEEHN
jgi:tetratricopeptide (TPR) repeat protein